MKKHLLLVVIAPLCLCLHGGCKKKPPVPTVPAGETAAPVAATSESPVPSSEPAKPHPKPEVMKDPVKETIFKYRLDTRGAYNNRRFNDLEKQAAEIRASKELFDNGSWKIAQFYNSFTCNDKEPENMWFLHDRIHQDWIAAKPDSITARVAYADFLTSYAWRARGTDYAYKVTEDGRRLFEERLAAAHKVLDESRNLPEKDPVWWLVSQRVAQGEGWPKEEYDALVAEANAFEPTFWGYDTARAYSLLPRWYGKPGDWEDYAQEASDRPTGLGDEVYARIVERLNGFYPNIFRDSNASWPKTRDGLAIMRKKYPDSLSIMTTTAQLAVMAEDRPLAKEMFDRLGDNYVADMWRSPEQSEKYRNWAETGAW